MSLTLRPSGAYRWANCPAYPSFASRIPTQPTSDAAREGTCAAWVAETVLVGDASSCEDMTGKTHKNGWLVTEEMAHDVQKYVDLVLKRDGAVQAEKKVRLSDHPLIEGTPDSVTHTVGDGILYIDDLKYGRRVVEVYENWQCLIYAGAVMRSLPAESVRLVQLGIYQPRAFHQDGIYRKWVLSVDELNAKLTEIITCGHRCIQPDPMAVPGKWCRDCEAATTCVALAQTCYALIDTIQSRHQRDMTASELGRELTFFEDADKVLKARRDAIRAEAETRIRHETIPGWKMTSRVGNREFTVPGEMIQMLTGKDPWEKKLVTPAEMERRGVSEEVLDKITRKPNIGHKLTPMTRSEIARVFSRKDV